ncbi:MAG: UDP-3-O-(3-hydroxymyristoyl)glucosamine N-acyltransferase [Sedimentitalea sp.]
MQFSIKDIALALGAEAAGDTSLQVTGVAEPASATATDLALAMTASYGADLSAGKAQAAVLWSGADWAEMGLKAAIFVPRPRSAMAGLTAMMDRGQGFAPGIHPTAAIDDSAQIGKNVSIGAFSCVGPGAIIGDNALIGPHCVIGAGANIGADAYLRDMISIGARVQIGARFVCQPGARIGSDGFSFVTPEVSGAENVRKTLGDQGDAKPQAWMRIHSLGAVEIGDDVEIGANCTIDNGTVRNTRIGNGTKLDNQVHLGHNVSIGNDCLICGQCGLSGSVTVGNNVVMGGQCGAADNIFIGDNVVITGATKMLSNVPSGRVMMGYPAIRMDLHTEIYKAQRRLPRLARDVAALQKAVFKTEPNN